MADERGDIASRGGERDACYSHGCRHARRSMGVRTNFAGAGAPSASLSMRSRPAKPASVSATPQMLARPRMSSSASRGERVLYGDARRLRVALGCSLGLP